MAKDHDFGFVVVGQAQAFIGSALRNDNDLCSARGGLGAELYSVTAGKQQRAEHEAEANFAGIVGYAENGEVGVSAGNQRSG